MPEFIDHATVDEDGQTLREVILQRLRWEYGEDAPWTELRSLDRLERDIRSWFARQGLPVAVLRLRGESEMSESPVSQVHNHPPYRPSCNERHLPDGQLRAACLNDDGSDR